MLITDQQLVSNLRAYSFERKLKVEIDNDVINDNQIVSESLVIKSSIMDDSSFILGGCIASRLSLRLCGISPGDLIDKRIKVSVRQYWANTSSTIHIREEPVFSGIIDSATRQKKREVVEICAYDEFYRMSKANCYDWFRQYIVLKIRDDQPIVLKDMIKTALSKYEAELFASEDDHHFENDFDQELSIGSNYNFNKSAELSISRDSLNRFCDKNVCILDLLKAYCELNAQFAYIDADGSLKLKSFYVYGGTHGSYATSPKEVDTAVDSYTDLEIDDYDTNDIRFISFPCVDTGEVIDYSYGYSDNENYFYRSENIITGICDKNSVGDMVMNFWRHNTNENFIFGSLYQYRPYSVATFGEWWLEPGDKVNLLMGYTGSGHTPEYKSVLVFSREIKGIAGMKVIIGANGQNRFEKRIT